MSMLTNGEIEELKAFFASPLSAALGHTIAAQSYEPRGKQGYDPSTDTKLASLVFQGRAAGKSSWARMKAVLDQLADAQVELLRRLASAGEEAVACLMPRALAAGRQLAEEEQRFEALKAMQRVAGPGIAGAMKLLEADTRFTPVPLTRFQLEHASRRAIELELVDVQQEAAVVIERLVAAFRAARAQVTAWRASNQAKDDERRAAFRAALSDRRAAKERSRFERTLRSAS